VLDREALMTRDSDPQPALFALPSYRVGAAGALPEHEQLAAALPSNIRLGAMTWSYRGWIGSVYRGDGPQRPTEQELARFGLSAYAQHPLLSLAELDRTYYEPLRPAVYAHYGEQVPEDFGFLVKAHELCTVQRFPTHARYGDKRGQLNDSFLDPDYATRAVVEPAVEGLAGRLLAVLWQFSPESDHEPHAFAERLHDFLRRLPKTCQHAVELRNRSLLTPEYSAALADTGALHCYNAWTAMPSILDQARRTPPSARRPLVIRWLLRPRERYEQARQRYEPFDKLVSEDPTTRGQVADLVARAHAHGVPSFILVDNKAEGSAPASIALLVKAILERVAASR
jgi:uncharacterized protein YecE (DUF72 family)